MTIKTSIRYKRTVICRLFAGGANTYQIAQTYGLPEDYVHGIIRVERADRLGLPS